MQYIDYARKHNGFYECEQRKNMLKMDVSLDSVFIASFLLSCIAS